MNKDEIIKSLSEKSFRTCIYCGGLLRRGYYAEDGIGKKLIFPKMLTKTFLEEEKEILIHFKCVEPFIFEMIEKGGNEVDATKENTKILVRY